LEAYPSKDGVVRVVKLKTKSGVLIRPLRKVCRMEIEDTIESDDPIDSADNPILTDHPAVSETAVSSDNSVQQNYAKTRFGRVIRPPKYYTA
ncbi:hypothetical protein RF55_24584, partial [Lasius niger]